MAFNRQQFFGTGEKLLKANLDEDIYQSKFINSRRLRKIYTKLADASTTLLSFILVYSASTRQLERLDPLTYFRETERKTLFVIIAVLALICYYEDKLSDEENNELRERQNSMKQGSEKIQNQEGQVQNEPKEKMIFQLGTDFLRVINYYLVYYVLDQDLFATTTCSHLIITKYALIILWVLFVSRKVLFWTCILVLQSQNGNADLRPWQCYNNIGQAVQNFQNGNKEKMQFFTGLANNLNLTKKNS